VNTEILPLPLGPTICYLVKEEGLILVDGGFPNRGRQFLKKTKQLSIQPKDISLLLLTHGHWDHIGSAYEIRALTGCQVAINYREKDWVAKALKPIPPVTSVWGKVWDLILRPYALLVDFPGTSVDLVLEDNEFSLEAHGIHGKVLYTPGHSLGSMSLLLNTGDAFVGDSAMNGFPMRIGPGMPLFAEDSQLLKKSWRLLLENGAKRIYPAHGRPFQADALRRLL
jgi:hydroxyacylglutathione hydrolase